MSPLEREKQKAETSRRDTKSTPSHDEVPAWLPARQAYRGRIEVKDKRGKRLEVSHTLAGAHHDPVATWPEKQEGRGYLGTIATCGNRRGNDLHNGDLNQKTWTGIPPDIIAYKAGLKAEETGIDQPSST